MMIPEHKKWENLTLSNDFIFCRVMRVKELCRELIEVLLNVKIKEINYIEDQKTINIDHETKGIRLDIILEGDDKIYNIEMQTRETKEIPRRIRYYESLIDINALEKGSSYRNLKDTIIIFICNFDMFKKNLPRYDFKTYCVQDKTIELDKGITDNHLMEVDEIWKQTEDHQTRINRVEQECKANTDKLSGISHLGDVDGMWNNVEEHTSKFIKCEKRDEELAYTIQKNKEEINENIEEAVQTASAAIENLIKKVKYAYWIAGGAAGLAIIELILILV